MNRLRISPGIKIAAAAAVSAAMIASAFRLGLAGAADHAASDLLYQGPYPMSGKIVLLQIDQKAVEEIGPYAQWGRGVIADVIDALNQSEDSRPAVIGLDILYSGETDRAEGTKTGPDAAEASGTAGGDARLAEAAGRWRSRPPSGTSTLCWTPTVSCGIICFLLPCRTAGRCHRLPWRQRRCMRMRPMIRLSFRRRTAAGSGISRTA